MRWSWLNECDIQRLPRQTETPRSPPRVRGDRRTRQREGRMRTLVKALLVLTCVGIFIPAEAFGQASITGVVRDSSGSILPGVTVEAASPALIEKVRSAVTDGSGQYRIVDLR